MKQRKFAVFDIDGTLIRGGLYRQLVLKLIDAGAITEEHGNIVQQKLLSWKRRESKNAYDEYEMSLITAIASSLTNIPAAVLDEAAESIAREELDHVYTYTRHRLRELKRDGYFLIAISGSQQELVDPFAKNTASTPGQRSSTNERTVNLPGKLSPKPTPTKIKFSNESLMRMGSR